jgi:toxin-antitoxin system PIN domain toxin
VILVDANILLYAEDDLNPLHEPARAWWDAQLSGSAPVCLCWTVLCAFTRIGTNPRVFERPLTLKQAIGRVQSWLDQPCVRLIYPTERHWTVLQQMLIDGQAVANLVTDAHLAALAVQHGCELMSTDSDFAKFPKVRWKNPLVVGKRARQK